MPVYTLRDIEVDFPYEAYPCQLEYMSRVIEALQEGKNALLESPTGTGKTLCLLCASLAWREAHKKKAVAAPEAVKAEPHTSELVQGLREAYAELKAERAAEGEGLPTIIYSSRTHSQLKQVMKELASTGYAPRTSVLGSRQQSCLNPGVQQLPSAAANQACRSLVSKRGCKWHSNVERFLKVNPDTNNTVMDIEELGKLGANRMLCPYYLSRDMAATADIVFMPYNYLVDPKTRGGLGITWKNAILIFDEAHNVESVCSDAVSFDLPAATLAGAIEEAGTAAELALGLADGSQMNLFDSSGKMSDGSSWLKHSTSLRQLQMVLQKLEREVAALKVTSERGHTAPGSYLFDLFARLNLTPATWPEMASIMEIGTSLLTNDAVQGGRRQGARATSYRLHTLLEAFTLAFSTLEPPREGMPPSHLGYRVHIHLEKQRNGERALPTLSYWCFNPGLAMAVLEEMKVRSILLTSGTLSPLGSFAQELTIPFTIRLENPHVIDPSQVWVAVVGKGPQGNALNSSYQHRNLSEYKEDLGNAIVNFARIVPDGLLVFFPSYGVLKQCTDSWRAMGSGGTSIWDRIGQYKAPVVEPRETSLFPAAAEDFRAKLDNPSYRGAVFFAVCRGKASEGLDFSDRAGRAVIITGIPYATKGDPKVQIKQSSLNEALRARRLGGKRPLEGASGSTAAAAVDDDDQPLSGDTWYVQQAIRAVNQAMGRVIRHRRDYGAIILADERFREPRVKEQLSKWLRDKVEIHPNFGASSASLTKFFKAQGEAAKQGLVGDGGQKVVPGMERRVPSGIETVENGLPGSVGAFQIARGKSNANAMASTHQTPHHPQQQQALGWLTMLQAAPAAADMAGLTAIVGGSSTDISGLDAIVMGLDDTKYHNNSSSGGMYSNRGVSGAAAPSGARPWERAASVIGLPPGNSRPRPPLGIGRAGGVGVSEGPASNMVGPAHKIEKHHHQQQQQQQQQGGHGVERKNAERPPLRQRPLMVGPPMSDRDSREGTPMEEAQKLRKVQRVGANDAAEVGDGRGSKNATPLNPPPPSSEVKKQDVSLIGRLKTELPKEVSQRVLAALRQYKIDRQPAPLLKAAAEALHPRGHRSLLEAFRASVPKNLCGTFDVQVGKARSAAAGGPRPAPLPQPTVPAKRDAPEMRGTGASSSAAVVAVRLPANGKSPGLSSAHGQQRAARDGSRPRAAAGVGAATMPLPTGKGPVAGAYSRSRPQSMVMAKATSAPPCDICNKSPSESPHRSTCCKSLVGCYSCWLKAIALRSCPKCNKVVNKNMLEKQYFV